MNPLEELANVRPCLRGHGPMVKQGGTFALTGMTHGPGGARHYVPDGIIFTAAVYVCPKCGAVELVDEEAR